MGIRNYRKTVTEINLKGIFHKDVFSFKKAANFLAMASLSSESLEIVCFPLFFQRVEEIPSAENFPVLVGILSTFWKLESTFFPSKSGENNWSNVIYHIFSKFFKKTN